MTTLYYYHDDFLQHDTGAGHPECAARLNSINAAIDRPQFSPLKKVTPELDPKVHEHIALIHSPQFIEKILQAVPEQGHTYIDSDTVVSAGSGQAALLAVSAACHAVDQVLTGCASNAFCALRPPGHHAEPGRAMGFCLFNNIAIAAAYARKYYDINRVAIVDFDVHHGNGTQKAFYEEADVLYASSHEMPHYPGTGYPTETGAGNIVNVPLTAGDGSDEFRKKYDQIILPAVKHFQPELILLSAGFDAHKDDPLASIRLETEDYAWVTRQIMEIADICCTSRIISVLEGGYNLKALGDSVSAHIGALLNI